jgi:cyclin B
MFDYLFKENLMFLTFKEFNYENLYLDLIEKQILKNRLLKIENNEKNNLLIINFIKKLINKYKINDNKENNINSINTKYQKKNTKSLATEKEEEDKDNNSTINNGDGDIEMTDEYDNKNNKNNNLVIYNKNPQDVDEYFDDICTELNCCEEKYLPDANYMAKQKDINHRMRAILIDWLIDVHLKYKMVPQTMYIAVNLIDRFLSMNETTRVKLQLVGVTSMFIASKYEEIYPPELKDFVYITDNAYVKSQVLDMESKMLGSLNFDITFPTQWSFLQIFRKKLDLDQKTFNYAWFLMELSLINYKMLRFKMSQIAASAIFIAIRTLNYYNKADFEKNTGYSESSIQECVKEINNYNIYNSTHSLQAIRRKFSSKKFDEVSKL